MKTPQCHYTCRPVQGKSKQNIRMEKKGDLRDFWWFQQRLIFWDSLTENGQNGENNV